MRRMHLNDEQIRYGFYYFFRGRKNDTARVTEVSEYAGEGKLTINCTQLGPAYKASKEKHRVLSEWCAFLAEKPNVFKVLKFGTRMPQELFDAVCHQQNLEHLDIKWGTYKDLSAIQNLKKLKLLYIGSGVGRFPQYVCKRDQAGTCFLPFLTRMPFTYVAPSATSERSSGASSLRKLFSATSSVFQITAVAFFTFLKRLAAPVRSRTVANGDSTTLVVRRCFQCSFGNA